MKKILFIIFLFTLITVQSFTLFGKNLNKPKNLSERFPKKTQPWDKTICYNFLNFLNVGRYKFENVTYKVCGLAIPEGSEQQQIAKEQLKNLWEFTNYFCLFSKVSLIIIPDFIIKAGSLTISYSAKIAIFLCNGILKKGLEIETGTFPKDMGEMITFEIGLGFVALTYLGLLIMVAYYGYNTIYGFTMFSKTVSALFGTLIGYIAVWVEVWPVPTIIKIAYLAATCTWWYFLYLFIIFALILVIGEILKRPATKRFFKEKVKSISERAAKIRKAR